MHDALGQRQRPRIGSHQGLGLHDAWVVCELHTLGQLGLGSRGAGAHTAAGPGLNSLTWLAPACEPMQASPRCNSLGCAREPGDASQHFALHALSYERAQEGPMLMGTP